MKEYDMIPFISLLGIRPGYILVIALLRLYFFDIETVIPNTGFRGYAKVSIFVYLFMYIPISRIDAMQMIEEPNDPFPYHNNKPRELAALLSK